MPEFVLEIGTEEVPADAVEPALPQLEAGLKSILAEARLSYGEIKAVGTPRRLVVMAKDLAERQDDAVVEHRGPASKIAFDAEGNPTRAAEGFARRFGLTPDQLEVREAAGGEYVFAQEQQEGEATGDVLARELPGLFSSLAFPKFMRWAEGGYRFSRPIRWILCLLDDAVVPFEVAGISSGRTTRGHRFLSSDPVPVPAANAYLETVRGQHVIVDPEERARLIQEAGNRLAAADGGRIVWDPKLLREVTYVVEYPTPFLGSFSEEYLELPRPVLVSAMAYHQRFFTVEDEAGKLRPRFLAVRNGGEEGLDIVRAGNERVLAFRFNDSVFFFNEDRKNSLAAKREKLKNIVFLERLGSLYDKSERLTALAAALCEQLGRQDDADTARRAAELCKCDLSTLMVGELPELQGTMGMEYALADGEPAEVARAIGEHYRPRHAGEELPETFAGQLLSLSDKLDALVAAFSLGFIPTGSADPFGLRRQAAAVISLLEALPKALRLSGLVDLTLATLQDTDYYQAAEPRDADEVRQEVLDWLKARVEARLEELKISRHVIEAVLATGFDCLPDTLDRARYLEQRLGDKAMDQVVVVGTRVRNILRPTDESPAEGDLSRLEEPEEKELAQAIETAMPELDRATSQPDWDAACLILVRLQPLIDNFFDEVLVNAEDSDLRAARHTLLRRLDEQFLRLADFSKIPTP